ncbi:hypothetical protein FRC12_000777, partial [Ceratobasidium sp. 428]
MHHATDTKASPTQVQAELHTLESSSEQYNMIPARAPPPQARNLHDFASQSDGGWKSI